MPARSAFLSALARNCRSFVTAPTRPTLRCCQLPEDRRFKLSAFAAAVVRGEGSAGDGRGGRLTPGEFRRQVWIGGTRPGNAVFVPPPTNEVDECLKHLERFLHDQPEPTPPLVKAVLASNIRQR